MNNNNSKRVLFVHPDLGIGGAERLVVDAALALLECGHQVEFFTSHCDPAHAFEEVKTGKVKVTVCGDWIPTHVFGRLHVMFAMLRMIWVSLWLLFSGERADVVFCDQVSVCVPFLRWVGRRVIFYIHFPDKLLAKPEGRLKALYRAPFDYLEERTTNSADVLVCNSKFTASIVKKHFPSISRSPLVLYPTTMLTAPNGAKRGHEVDAIVGKKRFFLSLNRFEKKKNLELAVEAFALLDEKLRRSLHLVLAGGFDDRVEENARVYGELERLVSRLGLKESVSLVKNLNQESKLQMLQFCIALVYTPPNEHFGIVPLEAMVLGRPVVASNSGGPTETVADEQTGFLCEDNAASFARAMRLLAENEERAASMGKRAAERVRELFGPAAFKRQLANLVE